VVWQVENYQKLEKPSYFHLEVKITFRLQSEK